MIGKNVLLNKILGEIKNNLTDISQIAKKSHEELIKFNNFEQIESLILKNKIYFENILKISEKTLDYFRIKK